jgi:hypothetical protein
LPAALLSPPTWPSLAAASLGKWPAPSRSRPGVGTLELAGVGGATGVEAVCGALDDDGPLLPLFDGTVAGGMTGVLLAALP